MAEPLVIEADPALDELLALVRDGRRVTLTRNGAPVAELAPTAGVAALAGDFWASVQAIRATLPASAKSWGQTQEVVDSWRHRDRL